MDSNDGTNNRRQRDRNPITGDGMREGDSRTSIPRMRYQQQEEPSQEGGDEGARASDEELVGSTTLDEGAVGSNMSMGEGGEARGGLINVMTLQDVNSVPATLEKQRGEAGVTPTRVYRQRQRDRNPITGDGMTDRDYRATVPSFKIHGPQRKEGNPLNFEGYGSRDGDDRAYRSDVQAASVSPLTRGDAGVSTQTPEGEKPQSRQQRQRDRNPITGYGMEERDFRVQIPTFKIHGPQRQGGDPLTGDGYAKNDRDYQRRVQEASDSPLSAPPSPSNGGN